MKQLATLLFLGAALPVFGQVYDANYKLDATLLAPAKAVESITKTELRKHLTFIASDELKGRDTGSPELDVAARYLAAHLESYGFRGAGKDGSFFQEVPLHQTAFNLEKFVFTVNKKPVPFEPGTDAAILGIGSKSISLDAPLLFAGNGLHTEQHKSYNPDDVKGKIVIHTMLDSTFAELMKTNPEYNIRSIRRKLVKQGAVAVVLVIQENDAANQLIRGYHNFASQPNLSLKMNDETGIYILLSSTGFEKLMKAAKIKPGKDKKFPAAPVFKASAIIQLPSDYKAIKSKNVVATLEGSDPVLKNEYVGFGAHYDHVGYRDTLIFNGADDDGSGTVGVLNIARALSVAPPKRSTLVVFHTGEEKGLFGSEFYADNPLVPMEKLVAMVNMDMIGSDYQLERVHVVGADRISRELHDVNELVNASSVKMVLDYTYNDDKHPERIYYRSDHYNYAKKGVPVIFFTNDNPKHYHKHTDEVSTINFEKMERIARLALQTGYYVSNKPARLVLNPVQGTN